MSRALDGRRRDLAVGLAVLLLFAAAPLRAEERPSRWFWPSLASWREATLSALKSRQTWVPAAASAVFLLSDLDEDVSDWAIENQPIFGSAENAVNWSDYLVDLSHAGMIGTTFAVEDEWRPWRRRLQVTLYEHVGVATVTSINARLKDVVGRTRPTDFDDRSFPSGHTSKAYGYFAGTRWNLTHSNLPPAARRGLGVGLNVVAAGTGWARIEAGAHYPSDVLFGAALGNFIATVINEAFLDGHPRSALSLAVDGDGARFEFRFRY